MKHQEERRKRRKKKEFKKFMLVLWQKIIPECPFAPDFRRTIHGRELGPDLQGLNIVELYTARIE